jgi:acetoacetyl-CoA reductase
MVAAMPEDVLAKICAKIPLGRLAKPQEIAKATAFLAVDGDYITGQELNINGGISM